MKVLEVEGLEKNYPAFHLDKVSFSVEKGKIVGLVGRNGAGKSTALKGILNLIRTDGSVKWFGKDFFENEQECKQKIGYVSGGFSYYKQKKLSSIKKVTASFYPAWDEDVYKKYLALFELDETKRVNQLSEGMKVKFSIALQLSHGAEVLILDEPTSGLDPLSREEICDILWNEAKKGISVLFSTHITEDLSRIADEVIFISKGRVLFQEEIKSLIAKYNVAVFPDEYSARQVKLIGGKETKEGFVGLVDANVTPSYGTVRAAELNDIMIHFEKEIV